jgi:hypothetical protein
MCCINGVITVCLYMASVWGLRVRVVSVCVGVCVCVCTSMLDGLNRLAGCGVWCLCVWVSVYNMCIYIYIDRDIGVYIICAQNGPQNGKLPISAHGPQKSQRARKGAWGPRGSQRLPEAQPHVDFRWASFGIQM